MSSSLGPVSPVYKTLFSNYDDSSENLALSRSEDEAALSCAENWIEPDDAGQVNSTSTKTNAFLGDPEQANSAINISEKLPEIAINSVISNRKGSKTKHSTFPSLKINESKLFEEAMAKLAGLLRLKNQVYSPNNQLRAFAELARLLESEGTKSLLNKALVGDYKDLIELANSKGWTYIKEILLLNACEKGEQSEQLMPISSKVNHNGHNNNCNNNNGVIEEKNIQVQSNESMYPFYPGDEKGIYLEHEFLKTISNEGKNKKINKKRIKELVQAYPLFTDEVGIIKCLTGFDEKNKEYVLRFFKELSRNSLPGQLQKSTEKELQSLHGAFKTEKILKSVEIEQASASKKVQKANVFNNLFTDWRECDIGEFSLALSLRDCRLVQKIKVCEVKDWFYGRCEQPQAVIDLEKTYEATVQWIAYQIVSELDENKRQENIQKFFKIGCTLNKIYKNFHNASQIAQAFKQPSVYQLLPKEYLYRSDFIDLMFLASDECMDSMKTGNSIFPINQTFWEGWRDEYKDVSRFDYLESITKYLLNFKNFNVFDASPSNNSKNDIHAFVANLKPVPFDTIDGLHKLFYKMEGNPKHCYVKLADWDPADLAYFILKNNDGEVLLNGKTNLSLLNSLYSQGIYNGKQFIAAFSKNKNLIESKDWTFSKQLTIWGEYLLHLSS